MWGALKYNLVPLRQNDVSGWHDGGILSTGSLVSVVDGVGHFIEAPAFSLPVLAVHSQPAVT